MAGNIEKEPANSRLCENSSETESSRPFYMPLLVGHRGVGAGSEKQENTADAINRCKAVGSMAEIDAQLSADKDVFVMHDLKIEDKLVENISTAELLDKKIELLSDILDRTEIDLNIEVKYDRQATPVDIWCMAILDVVKKHTKPNRRVIFSSFDRGVCEEIHRREETVLFLTEEISEEAIQYAIDRRYAGIVTNGEEVFREKDLISKIINTKDLHLITYGIINSEADKVHRQIDLGVYSIITDEIEYLSRDRILHSRIDQCNTNQ